MRKIRKGGSRMVSAMLMIKNPAQKPMWKGAGRREFAVLPRVGEYVELEVDGEAYMYKVVSVQHPGSPAWTAGDLFAVQAGRKFDVMRQLYDEVQRTNDRSLTPTC